MSDDSLSDNDIPILVDHDQSLQIIPKNSVEIDNYVDPKTKNEKDLPAVPVTILTGFLGSGKTTLIQYILRSPDHGKKIAVIENEFSGVSAASSSDISKLKNGSQAEKEGLSIETLIARDGTNSSNLIDLIELPNGCICCTVKDSLVATLETLLDKKRELDYIIIECSGMANPGPVASIFWLDDALESRIRLDGIVTCVDARNLEMQLQETNSKHESNLGGDEAAQQIAYADRIIVNKTDLLEGHSEGRLKEVLKQIRSINSTAPLQMTTYSQIKDLTWVLDANCFDAEKVQNVEEAFVGPDQDDDNIEHPATGEVENSFCKPCTTESKHSHTNAITTIALIEKGSICLKRMNSWLASVLWPDQDKEDSVLTAELKELEKISQITTPELVERRRREETQGKMLIFRIKGVLSAHHLDLSEVEDEDKFSVEMNGLDRRKHIVQAVNDLWEINPLHSSEDWHKDEERICKIVLIGRNLNENILSAGFRECFSN
jgi:G3E family GTPase